MNSITNTGCKIVLCTFYQRKNFCKLTIAQLLIFNLITAELNIKPSRNAINKLETKWNFYTVETKMLLMKRIFVFYF